MIFDFRQLLRVVVQQMFKKSINVGVSVVMYITADLQGCRHFILICKVNENEFWKYFAFKCFQFLRLDIFYLSIRFFILKQTNQAQQESGVI